MLDIGFQEILVLMVVALLVFGPDKLPELGRRLGRAMREFRRASDEFRSTIETNLQINEESLLPPSATSPVTPAPGDGVSAAAGDGSGQGVVAAEGAQPDGDAAAAGAPTSPAEPTEPFWARRGGRILHRRSCSWRERIPADERIGLEAAADGRDKGLLPCPVCDPREAEASV